MPTEAVTSTLGSIGVELDLSLLTNIVRQLKTAISSTSARANQLFQENIGRLEEHIDKLREEAEKGSPKASEVYDKVVETLKDAAGKGKEQARELLKKLGIEFEPDVDLEPGL